MNLMTPLDVELEAKIPRDTQAQWRHRGSHNFNQSVVKIGRLVRYDRVKFESWLQERSA